MVGVIINYIKLKNLLIGKKNTIVNMNQNATFLLIKL